jgi:broad specificity phosphatase PhoE
MFQSKTNPDKKFGSIFRQRKFDKEHANDEGSKSMVYCMRHGQTALDDLHRSDGWLDLPLDDDGRKNVVITFDDNLKDAGIKKIFASPLRRVKETAEIVKSGLPSEPTIEIKPDIKTWNLGSLAGSRKKPNKKIVKDLLKNPHKSAPDGESYDEFKERFDSAFKDIQDKATKEGPFLVILSGSCCRRLSEKLFDDRNVLDIDESGLFVVYKKSDGAWTAKEIVGSRSDEDKEKNPEAS